MRAVILQPGYLPWIGFFDLAAKSDIFVILDCVQFDKRSWRNRNRIRTSTGWQWLSVPVITKGRFTQRVSETLIDNTRSWAHKHLSAIKTHYSKAPYFAEFIPLFEEAFNRDWESLLELDMYFIRMLDDIFELRTNYVMASTLEPTGKKADLILELAKVVHADHYLNGDMGRSYLSPEPFAANGIELEFHNYVHPTYKQCYEGFESHLSAIDLLFNCGREGRKLIVGSSDTI
ncbi:MAG: WbqC family protein [Candidatus Coatesbacteria bacterium]|nr:WbqC family protein [Candidatus Coatesbacteria bacterium]